MGKSFVHRVDMALSPERAAYNSTGQCPVEKAKSDIRPRHKVKQSNFENFGRNMCITKRVEKIDTLNN